MTHPAYRLLARLLFAFLIAAHAAVAAAAATDATPGPWPTYNNGYDGQRFSPLKQINTGNVKGLKRLCEVKLGEIGQSESGPIVIGRTIYLTTLKSTLAIDAGDCHVVWRHVYEPEEKFTLATVRGAAYYDGIIVRGTTDARLLGIDAKTGKELWRVKAGDPKLGHHFTSAPIAWKGLVFMGTAGSEWQLQSRMMAFDVKTGKEVWHFNLIPQDGEPGAETWTNPPGTRRSGGGTWTTYTLDTETGELFVPVGNPTPAMVPSVRQGDNLYSNSVVGLDALTGKLRWYFQTTPADPWDYDQAAAPVIYRTASGTRMLVAGSKDGYLYGVNRDTRERVFKTAITTINDPSPIATPEGVVKCPGFLGGVEWNGPAYDPRTRMLYVGSTDWCMIYKLTQASSDNTEGVYSFGGVVEPRKTPDDKMSGWVHGIDAASGAIRWKYHAEAPVMAAITPTAGGLVLGGDLYGNFFALDAKDGRELYKLNTGGSMAGGVLTYPIGKKQYIALLSGSITRGSFVKHVGTPRLVILTTGLARDEPRLINAFDKEIDSTGLQLHMDPPVVTGRNLFQQTCAACHGGAGEGSSGPSLIGLAARKDAQQMESSIKNPKAPMPRLYPDMLKDADVSDLIEFIKTLK